jgi:hypothetical protein
MSNVAKYVRQADPVKAATTHDAVYFAGVFDVRGKVCPCKSRLRDGRITAAVWVLITLRDQSLLNELRDLFGGAIKPGAARRGVRGPQFEWRIRSIVGLRFLEAIKPHVRLQWREVALAIDLMHLIPMKGQHERRFDGTSDADVEARNLIARQISQLRRERLGNTRVPPFRRRLANEAVAP